MSEELRRIIPVPPQAADEVFAAYQTTTEFYQEIKHRQEFERYCQWYYMTAQNNRQELRKMRGEINLFSWFRRVLI